MIVCDCAPLSLHDIQAYLTPVAPLTGELADKVCEDPSVQLNSCGVVMGVPSTDTNPEPVGFEVTVTAKVGGEIEIVKVTGLGEVPVLPMILI